MTKDQPDGLPGTCAESSFYSVRIAHRSHCQLFLALPFVPSSTLFAPMAQGIKSAKTSAVVLAVTVAAAAISAAAALISVSISRRQSRRLASRIRDLEASIAVSEDLGAAERRGRIRAQQALRKTLAQQRGDESKPALAPSYPMTPIGTIQSCFSTRNGTPRQPILVPLARARLVFDPTRVPPGALEGLADYSHCWVLYVFHLNTDLEKIWKPSSQSKFKAKVRVPRLKGGKMGALATRSPHRPCPIGLTVAKVEALDGLSVLLSGVDIVDGTPVLDIKPYLPFTDSIEGATVPKWLETEDTLAVASVGFSPEFASTLSNCWFTTEKNSLYASAEEFQRLIKEVLSWDIRSLRERTQPPRLAMENESQAEEGFLAQESNNLGGNHVSVPPTVTYHLILEGINISYRMDGESNIMVEKASLITDAKDEI